MKLAATTLAACALLAGAQAQSTNDRLEVGSLVPPLSGEDLRGKPLAWDRWPDQAVVVLFHAESSRFSDRGLEDLRRALAADSQLSGKAAILVVTDSEVAAARLEPDSKEPHDDSGDELAAITVTVAADRRGFERYRAVAFPTAFCISPERKLVHVVRGHGPLFTSRGIAAIRLAVGLIDQRGFEAAVAPNNKAKADKPRTARSLRAAQRMFAKGMLPEADAMLEKALEQSPEDRAVLELLARVQLAAGQLDQAEASIARLEKSSGRKPASRLLRAELALLRDQPDLAETEIEGMPSVAPRVAFVRARILDSRGQHQEAAVTYRRLLDELLRGR